MASYEQNSSSYDAVVLGCGISGMVSAAMLADQGKKKILLIDEYSHMGGNHISFDVGAYSFDIGSFFFNENSDFFKIFPDMMQHYIRQGAIVGKINPKGLIGKYPFDIKVDILASGWSEFLWVFLSLVIGRVTEDRNRNALNFVNFWIGRRLGNMTGLVAYLRRFYGVDPSKIEGLFAQKRMRWVSANASISNVIAKRVRRGAKSVIDRPLIRPREGFEALYRVTGAMLESKGVEIKLGTSVKSIERLTSGLQIILSDESVSTPLIVSTMPLAKVTAWCGLNAEPALQSANLISLMYSFKGNRGFSQDVLYNFTEDGAWKRLTMHSDYYGLVDGRSYFSVEVISRNSNPIIGSAAQDFLHHVKKLGLFKGDLKLEKATITQNVYPVYLEGATEASTRAIDSLREFGILSFGRQGGFDYQPTANVSTAVARERLKIF